MKTEDILLLALLSSPHVFVLLQLLFSVRESAPFTVFGAASVLAVVLLRYSLEAFAVLVAVPSSSAFILLSLGYPEPLIGLAAGYLSSLPLLILLMAYERSGAPGLTVTHLSSLSLSLLLLRVLGGERFLRPHQLLLNVVPRILGEPGTLPENLNQLFTALAALSAASLALTVLNRLGASNPLSGRAPLVFVLSSFVLLTVAVASWSVGLGGAAASLAALLLTSSLVAYLRLSRD